MSNLFYTVKRGDTLSGIAQRNGASTQQLQKINGIQNPDNINEGQAIALKAEAVCKVDVQLLDHERNPIKNVKMRLDYCGKSEQLSSGDNGRVPSIFTDTPEDTVKILMMRMDGTWKQITEITSDWGNKLVTLVSPKVKIETKTMPHPKDENGKLKPYPVSADKAPVTRPDNPETTEAKGRPISDYGDGKGLKSEHINDKDGFPFTEVTNDQVKLDFLGGYTGEEITEEDYKKAAKELGCEVEVIRAIGEQETKKLKDLGLGSFDKKNRPTILYERHYFSRLTKQRYDHVNPDISSPTPYKQGTARPGGKPFDDGQHFGLFSWQYKKLAKAYSLDKEAAIRSCSWGAFQVMGDNFKACGFSSASEFAKAMCKSELEHLKAMVAYCKANNLQTALKSKDWQTIAKIYNGPDYKKKKERYDLSLQEIYNKLKKKGTSK